MGGCRCSYRNCTVRSDGITHMFHYPVFDKVRCHQWLTNAHKLEFLLLKLSQLKNRVVCQHHFKDDCFMNFKKDKLKFNAVPTLDGPYCNPSQYDMMSSEEVLKMYPISIDDIENEHLTLTDKKANFSVKYGNFLTNGDIMDLDLMNNINNNTKIVNNTVNDNIQRNSTNCNIKLLNEDQKESCFTISVVEPLPAYHMVDPVVVGIEFEDLQLSARNMEEQDSKALLSTSLPIVTSNNIPYNENNNIKESKVRILSEKNITQPIIATGCLEPLSPSQTIRVPQRKIFKTKNEVSDVSIQNSKPFCTKVVDNSAAVASLEATEEFSTPLNQTLPENNSSIQNNLNKSSEVVTNKNVNSPSRSLLKNKNNPDRVAAIEEKRKFNMKLRDIIESYLDKIDDQEKIYDDNSENNLKVKQQKNTKVGAFLSKEEELPSVQEYTINCLETRIKRMENLLLNKIDQNSQRILELKNSICGSGKQLTSIEKTKNVEHHKRQLYKEISQYLSPDANSLIYEELFINKYVQKAPKSSSSPKRRRKR